MKNKKILSDDQLSEISGGKIILPSGPKEVELIVKYDSHDNIDHITNIIKNELKSHGVPDSALSELPTLLKIYTDCYKAQKIKITWREGMSSVRCEQIYE